MWKFVGLHLNRGIGFHREKDLTHDIDDWQSVVSTFLCKLKKCEAIKNGLILTTYFYFKKLWFPDCVSLFFRNKPKWHGSITLTVKGQLGSAPHTYCNWKFTNCINEIEKRLFNDKTEFKKIDVLCLKST